MRPVFIPLCAAVIATALPSPAQESGAADPAPGDSASETGRGGGTDTAGDTASAGARVYEYIAHPTLQVLTWPVDVLLAPAVRGLTLPIQAPIRYFMYENVIDRTINLISFGNDNRALIYPTLSLAPGTSSRTGLTLRHMAPFGRETEKLVLMGLIYVNGDLRSRSYLEASGLVGSEWVARAEVATTHQKNAGFNQPGTSGFLYHSDTSYRYSVRLTHPLPLGFSGGGTFFFRHGRFGRAPPNPDDKPDLQSDFFLNPATGRLDSSYRGLNQRYHDRTYQVLLRRDSRNNDHIPLSGSKLALDWVYHDVSGDHDFHGWQGVYTRFFKLGSERYEITSEEERGLGGASLKEFIRQLEYEKLRRQIFSRKVVVLHLHAGQSYEVPGNSMVFYGLRTLGNDSPLRGYPGSRFRDYLAAGVSAEYRFPLMRLMDGVLFNEYGWTGRSWGDLDYFRPKNSWGFGIRVRRPDIFLFRADLAIHGFSGMLFNLSVDAPY